MAILHQFFSQQPFTKMYLKDGTEIIFLNHRYLTEDEAIITELNEEVKKNKFNVIYTKPDAVTVETATLDPMSGWKDKMKAEIRSQLLTELVQQNAGASERSKIESSSVHAGLGASNSETMVNTSNTPTAVKVTIPSSTVKK